MDRQNIKVFIASPSELEAERSESIKVIVELNKRYPNLFIEPVLFELDTASGNFPWKTSIQDNINTNLRESHIVIVIFYSYVGEFTLEELTLATKEQKKVFLFFKDGFIPQKTIEGRNYLKVLELKDLVERESLLLFQSFNTILDYNGLIYKNLDKHIYHAYTSAEKSDASLISTSFQHIPLAPRPYLAHPYPIAKNFTGRLEEINQLTEWLKTQKKSLCVVEAIGGMGKSALCWKWLQDEVITNNLKFDGIIWWSFYDQGFDDFIHHVYHYCVPEIYRPLNARVDVLKVVINILTNRNYLIILDGFERELVGYAQMSAMYNQEGAIFDHGIDAPSSPFDIRQRTPITPDITKLIRSLTVANTKTLMTTRLFPVSLEGLDGIKHMKLLGLSKADAVDFFRKEGMLATKEEMIKAAIVYDSHPLMLKLLCTAIKRSFRTSINGPTKGFYFTKGIIDENEPKKIFSTSYNLLNKEEQKVATRISVFRTSFTFEAAETLLPEISDDELDRILIELFNLGFIFFNEDQKLFDLHPVMRAYLYLNLPIADKKIAHRYAINYFSSLRKKERIVTLSDIMPLVEQFHHLILDEQYKAAYSLYFGRLRNILYWQLAQYHLCISLCNQFLDSKSEHVIGQINWWSNIIFNELALCHASVGNLEKAKKMYASSFDLYTSKGTLATIINNISQHLLLYTGKFSSATILLESNISDSIDADPPLCLAIILNARAIFSFKESVFCAEHYLKIAFDVCRSQKLNGHATRVALEYVVGLLSRLDIYDKNPDKNAVLVSAFNWSMKAISFAIKFTISSYGVPLLFLNSYEAIGRVLIAIKKYDREYILHTDDEYIKEKTYLLIKRNYLINNKEVVKDHRDVYFYDEYFENIREVICINRTNYNSVAERCINEGLALSRRVNRIYSEGNFLLLLAQLEWSKGFHTFDDVEKILDECSTLAERIEYTMLQADIHLFCCEILLTITKMGISHKAKIIGKTIQGHIAFARKLSKDMSDFDDIGDFAYSIEKNELYEKLRKGISEEDRIKNGYYALWLKVNKIEESIP